MISGRGVDHVISTPTEHYLAQNTRSDENSEPHDITRIPPNGDSNPLAGVEEDGLLPVNFMIPYDEDAFHSPTAMDNTYHSLDDAQKTLALIPLHDPTLSTNTEGYASVDPYKDISEVIDNQLYATISRPTEANSPGKSSDTREKSERTLNPVASKGTLQLLEEEQQLIRSLSELKEFSMSEELLYRAKENEGEGKLSVEEQKENLKSASVARKLQNRALPALPVGETSEEEAARGRDKSKMKADALEKIMTGEREARKKLKLAKNPLPYCNRDRTEPRDVQDTKMASIYDENYMSISGSDGAIAREPRTLKEGFYNEEYVLMSGSDSTIAHQPRDVGDLKVYNEDYISMSGSDSAIAHGIIYETPDALENFKIGSRKAANPSKDLEFIAMYEMLPGTKDVAKEEQRLQAGNEEWKTHSELDNTYEILQSPKSGIGSRKTASQSTIGFHDARGEKTPQTGNEDEAMMYSDLNNTYEILQSPQMPRKKGGFGKNKTSRSEITSAQTGDKPHKVAGIAGAKAHHPLTAGGTDPSSSDECPYASITPTEGIYAELKAPVSRAKDTRSLLLKKTLNNKLRKSVDKEATCLPERTSSMSSLFRKKHDKEAERTGSATSLSHKRDGKGPSLPKRTESMSPLSHKHNPPERTNSLSSLLQKTSVQGPGEDEYMAMAPLMVQRSAERSGSVSMLSKKAHLLSERTASTSSLTHRPMTPLMVQRSAQLPERSGSVSLASRKTQDREAHLLGERTASSSSLTHIPLTPLTVQRSAQLAVATVRKAETGTAGDHH